MLVSNDFSMRMLGQLIPQVPGDKAEVYDTTFESVIRKIGAQQAFLDISRCSKLTSLPFGCLQMCKSLLYLDVSYTKLNDVRPITENCTALKALNVAGVQFMEGSSRHISLLVSLEVLVLRNSNVNDVEWVGSLPVLRSLDLGVLSIVSDPILVTRSLTRLQELLLDCTKIKVPTKIDNQFTLEHASVLRSMSNLRQVNVCESDWVDWVDYIKHVLGRPVCIQPSSRRTLLFEAVAANNFVEVHRLLTTGHDIDCRVTVADEAVLAKIWRARGTSMKLRAPFFMVSNVEEGQRPTALHLAIYFNSMECVQMLLDNGADLQLSAWFGDVKELEGKFNENVSLSQKQPRRVFTARQLVEGVFQRNVHRLTADMVTKKVAGWKTVVTLWYKRLVLVCDGQRGGYRMTVEEMDERIATMRIEAAEAEGNNDELEAEPELVSPSAKIMLVGGAKKSDAPKKGAAATKTIAEAAEELSDQDTAAQSADEEGLDAEEGETAKRFVSKRDKIIERKRRLFEWREHGIVEKVAGKPVMLDVIVPTTAPLPQPAAPVKGMSSMRSRGKQSVRASTRESERFKSSRVSEGSTNRSGWTIEEPVVRDEVIQLPLLGAQSHWLESRALVIRDREVAYESTVLPGIIHKKDAVELALAAAATLRPVPKSSSEDAMESENVPTSGSNTPGILSGPHTPFMLSPPGTAPAHRPVHSRDAFSTLAPVRETDGFAPNGTVLASSSASMKRLSSSERRGRFLEQLSQRIEDRLNPDV